LIFCFPFCSLEKRKEIENKMSSPFGVSKGDLGNIVAQYKSKDLEPLEAAGGLKGLEKALNTNLKTGLSAEQVAAIEERKQL